MTVVGTSGIVLGRIEIDPDDLKAALELFDPIWDVLFPGEQARVIHLMVKRIESVEDPKGTAITFHPTGLKAIADQGY